MDPLTIGLLLGGGAGLLKGGKNQKKMEDHAKFREAAIRYSPWTGMGDPGEMNLPGMLESGISGAATGAMVGGMLGGPAPGATESLAQGAGGMAPAQMAGAMVPGAQGSVGSMTTLGAGANAMDADMMKWLMMNQQFQG